MSVDDRLDRLERRIAVLETVVRGLAGQVAAGTPARAAPIDPPAPPIPEPASEPPADHAPQPVAPSPPPPPPSPRRSDPFHSPISEQWIGQRGLLAVGVLALLMATGYLLKLSFDRGWIPPVLRCVGGVVLGLGVGGIGWRLHQRYRTYGAALIGCGAGIVYLSVWAACRLYEVVPPSPGVVGLALVSIALAMVAFAINVEALGAAAALGAFLAPALLGREQANANLLLLYLASMAAGLGLVAARCRWRLAMLVIAASYFGVALGGAADHADPRALLAFGLAGGAAGLFVGLRERWWETRLLTFTGGWALLGEASQRLDHRWPVLAAGIVLSLPVWWHGLRRPRIQPFRVGSGEGWSLGEALYFFTTPVLLAWAAYGVAPDRFDRDPGLLPLLIAIPYVIAGYQRVRPPFALVGAGALGIAAGTQWDGTRQVWALLALSLLWPALDHRSRRLDGRWYGLATLAAAVQQLFDVAGPVRDAADPAFVGAWALALWGSIAATTALAAGLFPVEEGREDHRLARAGLWLAAGLLLLFGVTGELRRHFVLASSSAETAGLAGGLAVSAWWLVFAAALVLLGFRRSLKAARLAGLAVAGLAVVKVIVFDLAALDALYRVGSVFLLGLVTLSLAYLYYRHDRSERPS
ncbi:MAG TPA: DUF2339 domain-containing protein [Gemmatimonadales bacterium]|nr:DUF2339 domain-containing protein [Gemmatimonadales bacterium]